MRRLISFAAWAPLAALPTAALAHAGEAHGPPGAPGWTFAPEVVVPLALVPFVYLVGQARLRTRARGGRPALSRNAALFAFGWALLVAALVSPLHEGGERSFALHMIEHEIIMLPAALLLVAARPGPVLLWGLPRAIRVGLAPVLRWPLWRGMAGAIPATVLQAAVLVLWHLPPLFDRALRSEGWHIAQHLSFVASALLFWWAMLPRGGERGGDGHGRGTAAFCLFVTSLVGGGLGALMALSRSPWYPAYAALGTSPIGLSPEQDQQLAGVIMWVPGGLFHLSVALVLLAQMLRGKAPTGQARKVSATV